MTELTRQSILDSLREEQNALVNLLSRVGEEEWHALARSDGWTVHDVVAHIADVKLATLATSGLAPRISTASIGVTLPMMPNGRINTERLNMLRFQINRGLSRAQVMARLQEAFEVVIATLKALDEARLSGPGPHGPPETMLGWFHDLASHSRQHRLELAQILEDQ